MADENEEEEERKVKRFIDKEKTKVVKEVREYEGTNCRSGGRKIGENRDCE